MGQHMGKRTGVTVARLKKILERQEPRKFGSAYIPSIFATREEAPGISKPVILKSIKLNREIHLLSGPEFCAAALALYHPALIDLHEQKMLARWPDLHPLAGLPDVDATSLPSIAGTVDVVARLGYLDLHPVVYVKDNGHLTRKTPVPFPYLGDLLLFLSEPESVPYCVNWTIKDKVEAFTSPGPGKHSPNAHDRRKALARFETEVQYHLDAGIRTQPIAGTEIDRHVADNLRAIYPFITFRLPTISSEQRAEVIDRFRTGMVLEVPPMDIVTSMEMRGQCPAWEATVILYQSIWSRALRVDLFKPVLMDYPLRPEVVDVIAHYADWFRP